MCFPELRTLGVLDQLRAAREGKAPKKLEIFIPSLFSWHAVVAVPRHDGLVLFGRDISDRVLREKEEAARSAVRKVVELMPLCVTITRGPQHRIEQANGLARALVGHREVEGELVEKVLPEARDQGFISLLDNVYASGETYRGEERELRWRPDAGEQERVAYFDLIYQPIIGDSGSVEGILHLRMHGVKLLGVGPSEYTAAYSLLTGDGDLHPPERLPLARAVTEKSVVHDAVWKIRRPDRSILRVCGNAKPILGADNSVVACVLTFAPCLAR